MTEQYLADHLRFIVAFGKRGDRGERALAGFADLDNARAWMITSEAGNLGAHIVDRVTGLVVK